MPWLQLKFDSEPDQVETLSDLLMELGASAVTFEDGADQPLFEPDPGETKLWNQTRLVGLFEADTDLEQVQDMMRSRLGAACPSKFATNPVEDKDWERAWMDNFKPIRCGNNLWICPSWHEPEDPSSTNVKLDPGLAFGTGTHPTTHLCLQWLDQHPPKDLDVIDYGCGSGILAVAAALLGARQIDAVDHDPQALLATYDNADKNAVTERIEVTLPGKKELPHCDLMLANILAGPLLELAPMFAELVKPGGHIVLSGILVSQADAVLARYQAWFEMDPVATEEDWVRLSGQRK